MRKSVLCSSLRTERWLIFFLIFFERLILVVNKSRSRRWTFERSLDFERRETLRPWTFKRSLNFFDEMKKFMIWFYLVLAH